MDIADLDLIRQIQEFDVNTLARTEDLGKNYNFEEVLETAQKIVDLSAVYDDRIVYSFPENHRKQIYTNFKAVLNLFSEIATFDNGTQNAINIRNQLIAKVEGTYNGLFDTTLKYKPMLNNPEKELGDIGQMLEEIQQEKKHSKTLRDDFANLVKSTRLENSKSEKEQHKRLVDLQEQLKSAEENQSSLTGEMQKISDLQTEAMKTQKEALENLKNELFESVKLDESRQLWENKRISHRTNYGVVGLFLIVLLLIVPGLTLLISDAVTNFLREQFSVPHGATWQIVAANQLKNILLIGLPISAYIWAVRILVRIFLSNQAHMDDAHERRVMLDTYLFLVGEGKANESDLHLILNALFRPTPGQAPDIDPPNLGDVIQLNNQSKS